MTFQAALPPERAWTWPALSTQVLSTGGALGPPLALRSSGSSQRRPLLAEQLEPETWATEWEAWKVTRIRGAHKEPVQAAWALWQPGESYSTVAIWASRG